MFPPSFPFPFPFSLPTPMYVLLSFSTAFFFPLGLVNELNSVVVSPSPCQRLHPITDCSNLQLILHLENACLYIS